MRIWLICHQFLPEFFAGTETVVYQTARKLLANGHDVTVICGHPDLITGKDIAVRVEKYSVDSINVVRFRSAHPGDVRDGWMRRHFLNEAVASEVSKMLAAGPLPDTVHVFHMAFLGVGVLSILKRRGIPIVFTSTDFFSICPLSHLRNYDGTHCSGPRADLGNCFRHMLQVSLSSDDHGVLDELSDQDLGNLVWILSGNLPENLLAEIRPAFLREDWCRTISKSLMERRTRMREALASCGRVIAPGKVMSQFLLDAGISQKVLRHVPFGLNPDGLTRFLKRGEARELRLLFIGQFAEHKGLKQLIEAVQNIPQDLPVALDIFAEVVADDFYTHSVLTLAGDDQRIRFRGTFPPSELGEVFSAHDVVVIPSLWAENTPMVLLASQACGCPAIVSNEEGLTEIVQDGVNGLTFETGNVAALTECIRTLAMNRTLLGKFAERTRVAFTIDDNVSKLEEIYREVALV